MRFAYGLLSILLLIATACSQEPGSVPGEPVRVSDLPQVHPEKEWQSDAADTNFYQHIGYESIPRDNGSFLIYDRQSGILFHLDERGELIRRLTRKGRGPGEVQDITHLVEAPGGGLLLYDQSNDKMIRFDENLQYAGEFIPEPREGGNLVAFYPGDTNSMFVTEFYSREWLNDRSEDMDVTLAQFFPGQRSYGRSVRMHHEVFAHLVLEDQVVGGTRVPYSPAQLIRYRPESNTFYLHLTGSGEIAEMNTDFDTLRTISVNLPREEISSAEIDSLEGEYRAEQWKTVREELPETKVPVENMVLGPGGEIWLRLNYRGPARKWLVMSSEGEPLYVVHLPAGAMLLHASEASLAVRLDATTVAVFEGTSEYREL